MNLHCNFLELLMAQDAGTVANWLALYMAIAHVCAWMLTRRSR